MQRATRRALGLVCAGILLSGAESQAQAQQGSTAAQTTDTAALQQTVQRLQSEVAGMQEELAQLRSELASLNPQAGVGGSGSQTQTGVTAPASHPPTAQSQDTASVPSTSATGKARVDAIYTGTVRSVSGDRLVLEDAEGKSFPIALGKNTAMRAANGQRISSSQLTPGTPVRATVDLLSQSGNEAAQVTVLSSSAPEKGR
jgi:outer membrane murein-binding lipoprotein Lpp